MLSYFTYLLSSGTIYLLSSVSRISFCVFSNTPNIYIFYVSFFLFFIVITCPRCSSRQHKTLQKYGIFKIFNFPLLRRLNTKSSFSPLNFPKPQASVNTTFSKTQFFLKNLVGFPSTPAFSYQTPLRCGKLGKFPFYDDLWALFRPFFKTCSGNHTFSRFSSDFTPLFPVFFPFFTQKISIFPKNLDLPSEPALPHFHLRNTYFLSFIPPDSHPHPWNRHLSPKKLLQVISLASYFFNKNTSPQESPIFPVKPHKTQKNHQKTSPYTTLSPTIFTQKPRPVREIRRNPHFSWKISDFPPFFIKILENL